MRKSFLDIAYLLFLTNQSTSSCSKEKSFSSKKLHQENKVVAQRINHQNSVYHNRYVQVWKRGYGI